MTPSDTIALSVLVQGRNDSYMGNFLWRLSTCINKHAQNIFQLQAETKVELVLTDWGSVVPLSEALTLTPAAKKILKIVRVPAEVAAKFDRDSPYSWVHAVNTGARRCQGEFILFCDSDGYFPLEGLRKLLDAIAAGQLGDYSLARSFFVGSRYHIPARFHVNAPSLAAIDEFVRDYHATFEHDKINTKFFGGNSAAYFWSRQIWEECRGFDEQFIYWGWYDIDLFIRLSSRYLAADLEDLGIVTYHLEHYSGRDTRVHQTSELKRKWNPTAVPNSYAPNPSDWGLLHEDLPNIPVSGERATPALRPASPASPEEELYFALHKVARFTYLMTVAISRDKVDGDKLGAQLTDLRRSHESILSVTNTWVARKQTSSDAAALAELQRLHQQAQQTMFRVFKDQQFQRAWQRIEPTDC